MKLFVVLITCYLVSCSPKAPSLEIYTYSYEVNGVPEVVVKVETGEHVFQKVLKDPSPTQIELAISSLKKDAKEYK